MRLVLAADHPFVARAWVKPEDLAGETLLVYPVDRSRLDVFRCFLWPAGVAPARVRTVESTTLLIELAALGQGVEVLPDWACFQAVANGRVNTCGIGTDGLSCSLHAVVRAAEVALPHVAVFLAGLQDMHRTSSS